MIRHCVFGRFRGDVDGTERAAIHADLEALRRVVDGMGKVEFSADTASPSTSAMSPRATPILSTTITAELAPGWSLRLKAARTG
jgi:hypothetical protein